MAVPSILIIDDEVTICFLLKSELEERGFATETVFTAEDGVQKIMEKDYDLVILDLNLGTLTGIDVLKSVNLKNKKTKILITSGYNSSSPLYIQAKEFGTHGFISKPSNLKDFLEQINSLLDVS